MIKMEQVRVGEVVGSELVRMEDKRVDWEGGIVVYQYWHVAKAEEGVRAKIEPKCEASVVPYASIL